jgi:hypothetical protein
MNFKFTGVSASQAGVLIQHYQTNCPLYGTLALAADVSIEFGFNCGG